MIKQAIYNFTGANQDTSKSIHPTQFYYEAGHIRLLATDTQSTGTISNEKGNSLIFNLPIINIDQSSSMITYGSETIRYVSGGELDNQISESIMPSSSNSQVIISHVTTRDTIILFSTDDEGFDCIWELEGVLNGDYKLKLLYCRNLGFSTSNPIQAIYNYENENIEKIYWVDGISQIRSINKVNPDIINEPSNNLNFVGEVQFSQPEVTGSAGGGNHTAGMIQYAYNLFRINGSQTKLSPLSSLYPLDKGDLGGGEVNEVVGVSPIVQIDNIDTRYTNIRVYAIKYTSYNQIPSINLIDERELTGDSVTIYDDGNTISSLSLEEFLFLGSDPSTPQHIASKDNRLFVSNLKDRTFILPDEMDMRAYSHNSFGNCIIYNNIRINNNTPTGDMLRVNTTNYNVPYSHDAVNLNYNVYKYQANGSTLGGEGKYLKYEIVQKSLFNPENNRLLKDGEIYRIGIQFYNGLGQTSLPKWTGDFRTPDGNLSGNYNTLLVELKSDFYTWLNNYEFKNESEKPVGYKILRANRTFSDRTIITQGLINPMMVNCPETETNDYDLSTRQTKSENIFKQPNFLVRTFEKISPLQSCGHLKAMQFENDTPTSLGGDSDAQNPATEIQHDNTEKRSLTYQFNSMFQLYSPDAMFDSLNLTAGLKFRIKGGLKSTANNVWFQRRDVATLQADLEAKASNGISAGRWSEHNGNPATVTVIQGNAGSVQDRGLIYNPNFGDEETYTAFTQWYRQFNQFIDNNRTGTDGYKYNIYGAPELTERGAGSKFYNNDPTLEYKNSLEGLLSDGEDQYKNDQEPVISVNSWGAKTVTIVLGEAGVRPHRRPLIENLYASTAINDPSVALSAEIVLPDSTIYGGNIYGGNSYEDKKRTNYIEIGDYKNIDDNTIQIDNAGDTFVQNFKFTRIAKTDTEIYQYNINQITEIVEFPVETTIDLKNRNDISNSNWDTTFQPRYDEYHKYNRVYSQEPTLVRNTDVDYTFQRVKNFDTRIQASSLKIPNETIDSWTNLLPNETMDLDGKYGPINNIISYKDNIFSFQDEGIASISINPRVQVQGSDGVSIQLGTGNVLYDYNYITDKSGSINKWSIYPGKRGIYYYDALNKSVGRVPDATDILLSDQKGLHTFFNNNYNYDDIKVDNPILSQGVVIGGDNYNKDVYITALQGDKSFTWCYNEAIDQFIDLKPGYTPSRYIYKGEKLLIPSPTNNNLYEQYSGEYNKFFGEYNSSYVIVQVNPDSNLDCVFTNILYKSELYLDDIDRPDQTLTHIQAYNEYQDSGRIPLILGRNKNLRRKFRKWQAEIPREANTRNRIRNPWIFLKLELDNKSNYKFILHNIIVNYIIY